MKQDNQTGLPELTLRGMLLGALITVVFTASNVYLGLKVGLTFSSAIPAAVISMAVLRLFSNANILENNMVQTQASAAGTLSEVIFILPGGDDVRKGLNDIWAGSIVSAAVALVTGGFRLLSEGLNVWAGIGAAIFRLPLGFSLALLGAGYMIGIVSGVAVLIGVIISWVFAVPILRMLTPASPGTTLAAYANGLWKSQVRFIGAGMIGVAAVWTLATLFKPMLEGVKASLSTLSRRQQGSAERTDQDMSPRWIIVISLAMIALLAVVFASFLSDAPVSPALFIGLIVYAVVFAFVFGFLVAAACGYMAGLIGSSSSPISGIGIVAVILVSVLLLVSGAVDPLLATPEGSKLAIAVALFVTAAIIAVAAIANDNLQDLKTGWLVGATPYRQQIALLIGCVVGAAVISPILELLYNAYGFTGALPRAGMDAAQALAAPQATLMTAIATGIFTRELNWTMLGVGVALGIVLIVIDWLLARRGGVARLPVLAVGIGIYLPPMVSSALFLGALLGWLIERALRRRALAAGADPEAYADKPRQRGILVASGLIVGESLVGVLLAAVIGFTGKDAPLAVVSGAFESTGQWLGLVALVLVLIAFARRILPSR
ncbi:OPT family oligopeptide transporter [Herbaspirillum huttiense]|uniref:OPT family oligopeptide transporter n=1 Tax=Herbaspirillum huttiense TaxID=863372 RepID=UPI0004110D6F|nr:oligopeptide transporter, OPT family [Herbaspirillum huttiense]